MSAHQKIISAVISPESQPEMPRPWTKVAKYIPKGYEITPYGVFSQHKQDPEFISGPCWVSALTRTSQSEDWGQVIHWIDQDGNEQRKAFPAHQFMEQGSPLVSELVSMGLKIIPGKQKRLMEYLGSFNFLSDLPSEFRLKSVTKLGWMDRNQENPAYVLPERTIRISQEEEIIFQPEAYSPTTNTMRNLGSLDQWIAFVATPCEGNPFLIFSLCTAFAGPLLKFSDQDSGGFHLYGSSSKGKTTALQVAASVWGCGADPAASENSYIDRWHTTANALEATAAAHNDGILILDEIGTCDARNFDKVIYDLLGGRGKRRLNKNSTLQAQRTWRVLGLSTGEISVNQKIEEDTSRAAKTGQLVRMIDIPIGESVIAESHGKRPGEYVDQVKNKCGRFYGTAGPLFLEKLITLEPDTQGLTRKIKEDVDIWERDLTADVKLEGFQQRVIRRFALVLTAGQYAVEFDILPFNQSEIIKAVLTVRDAWLGDADNKPAPVRGMYAVRDFILRYSESRFRDKEGRRHGTPVRELAGYFHAADGGLYLFTEHGLREACHGFDYKTVLKELKTRGHLRTNDPSKLKSRHTIDDQRRYLYAVKSSLLEI